MTRIHALTHHLIAPLIIEPDGYVTRFGDSVNGQLRDGGDLHGRRESKVYGMTAEPEMIISRDAVPLLRLFRQHPHVRMNADDILTLPE